MSGARQPCVILGFPRSGTTLLARLLDAHPEISCPPETNLMAAAARFLSEQRAVEGPPIGVLSGLGFSGLGEEEVMAPLREMVFAFHARIARGAPVWIEKTAVDIFHLEVLEPFLSGHARFIALTRNPLDVIASNLDLSAAMGAQLTELRDATRAFEDPFEGLARAWIDRADALDALAARQGDACFRLSYEELTSAPVEKLTALLTWIGVDPAPARAMAAGALAGEPRIGLGDFRVNATAAIRPPKPNGWRSRLPRAAASRIVPILAPAMEARGYAVPKVPPIPSREDALRQFVMSAQMKRSMGQETG
jgi:protein-tyrosine sulfotransferase